MYFIMRWYHFFFSILLFSSQINCSKKTDFQDGSVITTNSTCSGRPVRLKLTRGNAWGTEVKFGMMKLKIRPQIAVWIEDAAGNFKQNIYVTHRFATQEWFSIKSHPDSTYRTSSLPYWMNKLLRGSLPLPTKARPLPDAVTAATPDGSFSIESVIDSSITGGSIWCEFNSSFDNNERWPADKKAKESFNGQPSLLFKGDFSSSGSNESVVMQYMGHGGDSGADGNLYPNDSGITNAKEIITRVEFTLK
jgi:hypothetical protein